MIQENKELLLKDLCCRLPYGVKCTFNGKNIYKVYGIDEVVNDDGDWEYAICTKRTSPLYISDCKPYLFPLSSMTTIQENEFHFLFPSLVVRRDEYGFVDIISKSTKDKWDDTYNYKTYLNDWKKAIQWLLKNHFDINKLIPKNLAINATGLNIY